MDIQKIITDGTNVQLVVNYNDLKELCFDLVKEAFDQQKKLKEQENDGLLDSKQVMELLHVKIGTLWRWNKSGYLPYKKIGGLNYWEREDVYEIRGKREEKDED